MLVYGSSVFLQLTIASAIDCPMPLTAESPNTIDLSPTTSKSIPDLLIDGGYAAQ